MNTMKANIITQANYDRTLAYNTLYVPPSRLTTFIERGLNGWYMLIWTNMGSDDSYIP
jgi:hypothetical protein